MRYRVGILLCALVATGALRAEDMATMLFRSQQTNNQASPPETGGPGNTPGNRDFLSQLIGALEAYSKGDGQKLTFDYNFPKGTFGTLAGKIQVVLNEPVLNEKLAKQEAANAATVKTLKDELVLGDDVTVAFSISPGAKEKPEKIHRMLLREDFAVLNIRTEQMMAKANGADRSPEMRSLASDRLEATPEQLPALDAALRGVAAPATLSMPSVDVATRTRIRLQGFAAADIIETAALLAANQSKFVFDAAYHDRREAVGQDEWFVKASYEYGPGTDVAKRQQKIGSECRTQNTKRSALECTSPLAAALNDAANDTGVKTGTRLTVNLEYHDLSAVKFSREDVEPHLAFELPNSRSIVASLVGGRDIFLAAADATDPKKRERSGRLELSVAYDDVSGDKLRKDKLVGSLTYSQRVSDKVFIPVTVSYANHTDYLTNADHKLSAHFGISYKVPKK